MFCIECGEKNSEGSNFCFSCGTSFSTSTTKRTEPKSELASLAAARGVGINDNLNNTQSNTSTISDPPASWLAWVVLGGGVLFILIVFLSVRSNKTDDKVGSSNVAAAPPQPVATRSPLIEGALAQEAVACSTHENIKRVTSMVASKDEKAFGLMMLAGACELIAEGTFLAVEDLSLFGASKYRVRGTTRSLYVISPKFR